MPWLENVTPLTSGESAGLRDNLIDGLKALWRGTDDLISFTNKQKMEATIWQLMPDEDTAYLVDSMLTVAQKIPAAAAAVRALAGASHQLRIGTILLPRFVAMWQFYAMAGGLSIGGL